MTDGSPRYGYWRDPVCIAAVALYAVNRWVVPFAWKGPFLRGHFSDLLLIPAALPLWLWCERRLGWRGHDRSPRWSEVLAIGLVWTVAAEVLAPRLFEQATADPWDGLAYLAGAVIAGLCWRSW